MGRGQVARDNHYVPQFYLRRWSRDGTTVLDYSTVVHDARQREWKRTQIKGTAVWRDLYTQHNYAGINDAVERFFSDEIETEALPAFEKAMRPEEMSARDKESLVNYLISQLFRTPKSMRRTAEIIRREFASTAEEAVGNAVRSIENGRFEGVEKRDESVTTTLGIFPDTPLKIDINRNDCTVRAATTVGREQFLASIDHHYHGKVGNVLRSYFWKVITVPDGISLPTSDNPVVICHPEMPGKTGFEIGIGNLGTIVLLPLDEGHALFTQVGASLNQICSYEPNEKVAKYLIQSIILNADYHVYAKSEIPNIARIRQRRVDPKTLNELRKIRDGWDVIQMRVDGNLHS